MASASQQLRLKSVPSSAERQVELDELAGEVRLELTARLRQDRGAALGGNPSAVEQHGLKGILRGDEA